MRFDDAYMERITAADDYLTYAAVSWHAGCATYTAIRGMIDTPDQALAEATKVAGAGGRAEVRKVLATAWLRWLQGNHMELPGVVVAEWADKPAEDTANAA